LTLDIAGANAAGWGSFLVKTGVYDANAGLPPTHCPTEIVEDVEVAVKKAIEIVLDLQHSSQPKEF
jgi:ribonucleotide monophosphatase NagD (HAD superfamily)